MSNRKSKIDNNKSAPADKSPNVWRIYHFIERFEMDGYVRQNGLDFVRMFVTANTDKKSNESTEFLSQLAELEHYYPEQRDAYEGRFWRLLRLTAPKESWLRGYLLDADQKPLTVTRLAARLHLSVPWMKQTLAALKRVGLIEYVQCPEFKPPDRGKKDEKKKDNPQDTNKRKGHSKKRSDGSKTPKTKTVKKHSKTFQNVLEPFKKSESEKIEIENESEREILGLSSSDKGENQNKPSDSDHDAGKGQGASQEQTTTSPATAPPISPTVSDRRGSGKTVSDDGGPAKVIPFAGPSGSVDYNRDKARQIAEAFDELKARYNSNPAKVAGYEIYVMLGGPLPPIDLLKFSQDVGCFAKAWEKTFNSDLPPPEAAELWDSMIREAERLRNVYRKKPDPYQKAKMTWCNPVFKGKLAKRIKRCKAM